MLLNTSNCDLRVCDFGLARINAQEQDNSGLLTGERLSLKARLAFFLTSCLPH